MKKNRKLAVSAIVLVLFLAVFFCMGQAAYAGDKPIIAIGHLPHFTGAYGATQAPFAAAQEDAIEWANSVNYVKGAE
ncbi:MAG: hypothetical protein DRH90_17075, partial [Deltaproteobacteria bacterium]